MSSAPKAVSQVSERQDIHKSCRTLETLVNVLNDYCEAASAIVTLQKKLAKALKEAAGLKTTEEIAANAFSASAAIFDTLSDVDNKFAKIADKECSGITLEVRKWFKKLAKEEKAHDERMSDANARIKQAGQTYEKKSKKSARDAGEEHARYINLISVLGPEMSQEKYNHALLATQQHTSATFNVAACLSRIADAEWSRTCESIRRSSPAIGPLGQWRALCEGAWTGPLPDDLADIASMPSQVPVEQRMGLGVSEWGQSATSIQQSHANSLSFPSLSGGPGVSPSVNSQALDMHMPRPAFSANDQNQGSINSITTLSAFPFPPTHFPVPLAASEEELQRQRTQMQSLQVPEQYQTAMRVLSESPKPMEASVSVTSTLSTSSKPPSSPQERPTLSSAAPLNPPPIDDDLGKRGSNVATTSDGKAVEGTPSPHSEHPESTLQPRRRSIVAHQPQGATEKAIPSGPKTGAPIIRKADWSPADSEFGVERERKTILKSQSVDIAKKGLERTESSTSNQSIVAAMRNRYSRTIEPSSPSPKEVPKLPLSVSDLASRYQPSEEVSSPRRLSTSPTSDRHAQALEPPARQMTREIPVDDEIRRRKQRLEELAELELKEKEYELRQRERELNQKSRDFERDRQQFLGSRTDLNSATDTPKGPRSNPFQHRHSQSTSHLVPPSSSSASPSSSLLQQSRPSQSPSRSQPSTPLPAKEHAPFCGCDTCSVNKYKSLDPSPSPRDLRPPEPPILLRPEKPKGWIRRLSMPVVNASFSLDAKKNASATSLKSGLPAPAENGRLRKRSFEQGISSRTVAGVSRR
ncbi:hypothetical protein BV22DRAFT_1031095 [Leucogyrophana mollusca]|uniref:Uncharacterized protein n=1 Tax=Leucogyrophana mollusca TaxID=85980 RepID=A0ACB8BQB8_9AGAM|nr:hypothetical protein BV22DRAFT_1031095 [Leucogyrophana mollusca]